MWIKTGAEIVPRLIAYGRRIVQTTARHLGCARGHETVDDAESGGVVRTAVATRDTDLRARQASYVNTLLDPSDPFLRWPQQLPAGVRSSGQVGDGTGG